MWYLAGGYPGLYAPLTFGGVLSSAEGALVVEIPLRLIARSIRFGPFTVARAATVPARLVARVPVPMPQGVAARVTIPARIMQPLIVERH
jgi:hypothetical protein